MQLEIRGWVIEESTGDGIGGIRVEAWEGAIMKFLISCCLSLACMVANAEVVYLKRSEVFGYVLGQQAGQATAQAVELRQYAGQRQAGYAKLDALRAEIAKCGNCSNQSRLAAEFKELQTRLLREDGMMCGAIDSASVINPASEGLMNLLGFGDVCAKYNQESSIVIAAVKLKVIKEEFASRVKAGDLTAYSSTGRRLMTTYSHLPIEQRLDMACPYWYEGAKKGDRMSMAFLSQECQSQMANHADRQNSLAMLKACADRKDHLCAQSLAVYYETTRRTDRQWPVEPNDREALRLYQVVASHWESQLAVRPNDSNVQSALRSARSHVRRVQERLDGIASATTPEAPTAHPPAAPVKTAEAEPKAAAIPPADLPPSTQPQSQPTQEPQTRATRNRVDPKLRRCESLSRSVERTNELSARDPVRYVGRAAQAAEAYQRECE